MGSATEQLWSSVDRQVREIVEAAEARAADVERQAIERASEIEREARLRADGALQGAGERTERLLVAIDSLESRMDEIIVALRDDALALSAELRTAGEGARGPTHLSSPNGSEQPNLPSQLEGGPSAAPPTETEPEVSPAAREMIRRQLESLFENGTTREDAKRLLMRFERSDQYLSMLDEIYGAFAAKPDLHRRGLLRRRR